ncbi:DUF3006 family protein [Sporosarcina sp. HYO08]|uniref:DUF3006 family protein n=1 Tax=Sporosarcina sp. HYO08 TaxID=1759557 RepID=UPI00079B68AD|nr:DUF3006 family protein [Sporosarcina sp. HYO08]KXH86923.1 hypothetical protein AU377_13325 [Sporosarcina sp. HYO08]
MKKYTLDRIDDGLYVFLEYPDEVNQLLIPVDEVNVNIAQGDIVEISKPEFGYEIKVLKEETEVALEKVNNLLQKLKKKNL